MSILNVCKRITNSNILNTFTRCYAKKPKHIPLKVTVCGARGKIGQPLCLMLKQSPLIDELGLYDTNPVCGFGIELGHIDTRCKVIAYSGVDHIREAMEGASVVVIVAGAPKTSHLAYSAMFEANANIIQEIAQGVGLHAPNAMIAIATNPVNSMVPIASETLRRTGTYNPKRVFGITALDVVRTNTFVADVQGLEPENVMVPVIGGNADKTIIPVLSQARPCADFTVKELECITHKVQNAHHDVIKAKTKRSATLSAAFAIAKFVISIIKGLKGTNNVIECAYVRSKAHPHCKYLATPLLLGKSGIEKNLGVPKLSDYENCQLESAVPMIMDAVKKGESFVGVEDPPPCDPCDPSPTAPICPPNYCQREK
ncbi:hypothetical protein ILUMI_08825 [Ignelater luminosus]|uniref:Malate dehydrogenase, mitochondrial n=1 Tax=Ignelater luminosus TaxID=2038154 RepID=A0A8K0D3N5_IGNLU|nr:hypothetical protein ILUMI_08825 [Ignelater luminosus]